ncbi:hypothetical protein [Stenotrophomonas sp.]|uniref:hypothetical protein n=1 Tax=Stenotrophomonas sp. TaxID=69392 RepID=UPI0028A963C5|nr:hypothetical protein [Stenotrophomonas sp.]
MHDGEGDWGSGLLLLSLFDFAFGFAFWFVFAFAFAFASAVAFAVVFVVASALSLDSSRHSRVGGNRSGFGFGLAFVFCRKWRNPTVEADVGWGCSPALRMNEEAGLELERFGPARE